VEHEEDHFWVTQTLKAKRDLGGENHFKGDFSKILWTTCNKGQGGPGGHDGTAKKKKDRRLSNKWGVTEKTEGR